MDRYVVIGNPVAHSLSPAIHACFAEQLGERVEYTRLEAPPGQFARAAREFFEAGGRGANVTLPFKVDAHDFAAKRSARASLAGAANFLVSRDGAIEADNTDGAGLVTDLTRNLGVPLAGARVLLLGAGGAARGVIAPLLEAGPRELAIANRTAARATELAQRFAKLGPIDPVAMEAIRGEFDVVINATSSSILGEALELPEGCLGSRTLAYDMAYGPAARGFVERARASGARASDGLGMLIEQAAESWRLWRGTRPDTAPVLAHLRTLVPA